MVAPFNNPTSALSHPHREDGKVLRSACNCSVLITSSCKRFAGISRVNPDLLQEILAPSLHSTSLPKRDMGDCGHTVNAWFNEKGPILPSFHWYILQELLFPPLPLYYPQPLELLW